MCVNLSSSAAASILPSLNIQADESWKTALMPIVNIKSLFESITQKIVPRRKVDIRLLLKKETKKKRKRINEFVETMNIRWHSGIIQI
jgi:hypothetical protein